MLRPTALGLRQRLLLCRPQPARGCPQPAAAASSSDSSSAGPPVEGAAPGAAGRGPVAPPDVRRLAKMAQLAVTDEDVARLEPEIRRITSWFDQLQEADLEGVPPFTEAGLQDAGALREDVPVVFDNREALVAAFPETEGPLLKVPKIS